MILRLDLSKGIVINSEMFYISAVLVLSVKFYLNQLEAALDFHVLIPFPELFFILCCFLREITSFILILEHYKYSMCFNILFLIYQNILYSM